jgi:hypothetical protein
MSAALLARLTAHGSPMDGAGYGGIPEITVSDIAGAMAGLSAPCYQILRLKYCGDESMRSVLVDRVAFALLGLAMTGDIDLNVSTVKALAALIVAEAVNGGICDICNGTGVQISHAAASDCGACKATGRLGMSKSRAAETLGIDRRTYSKRYERLVLDQLSELQRWEGEGVAHIRRQLFLAKPEN